MNLLANTISAFPEERVLAAKRPYLFSTGTRVGAGIASSQHDILGNTVRQPLRNERAPDTFRIPGRTPDTISSGKLTADMSSSQINSLAGCAPLCGLTKALASVRARLQKFDFQEGTTTWPGDFVVERAFRQK